MNLENIARQYCEGNWGIGSVAENNIPVLLVILQNVESGARDEARRLKETLESALCMLAEGSDPELMAAGVRPKEQAEKILLDGLRGEWPYADALVNQVKELMEENGKLRLEKNRNEN